MQLDKHITEVIFRIDNYGVYALLPYEISSGQDVVTYQYVGQHSGADYKNCILKSKLATLEQYKDLFNEMTNLGYNLKVVIKQNYTKYLKSYYKTIRK